MIRVFGLLSVLYFVFFLYCLLDVVLSESSLVRNLPKLVWVFIVLIVPLAGGIAWLVAGRPERATAAPGSTRSRPRRRRPQTPMGPDDDPGFLRRLDEQLQESPEDEPDES